MESFNPQFFYNDHEIEDILDDIQNNRDINTIEDKIKYTTSDILDNAKSNYDYDYVHANIKKLTELNAKLLSMSSQKNGIVNSLSDHLNGILEELKTAEKSHAIAKKGVEPSVQGYREEGIGYEDYVMIQHIKSKPASVRTEEEKCLMNVVEKDTQIAEKIESFERKIDAILLNYPGLENLDLEGIQDKVKSSECDEETLNLILEAKNFQRSVWSDEGSFIDILDFKEHGDGKFKNLDTIEKLARIQSLQLDEKVLEDIVKRHESNLPAHGQPSRVLIEGAGPLGLYASFHMYESGGYVSVVNDRSEEYIRNQILRFDPKLMMQLQYYLGTKYEELFGKDGVGKMFYETNSGAVNTKQIEDRLKTRVVELQSYVEASSQNPEETTFTLRYEADLTAVKAPDEKHHSFYAEITEPDRKSSKEEEFDLLFCVGGANDKIRDKYLSPALPFTVARNYGISVWEKGQHKNEVLLKETHLFKRVLSGFSVVDSLERNKLGQFIQSAHLSSSLKDALLDGGNGEEFDRKLIESIATNKDPPSGLYGLPIRSSENKETLFVGTETPPPIENVVKRVQGEIEIKKTFIKELDKKIAQLEDSQSEELEQLIHDKYNAATEVKKLQEFKRSFEKIWLNSVREMITIEGENGELPQLQLDPNPINMGTFDVQQKAVVKPSKILKIEEADIRSMIAAIAESLGTAHFFSGSGLSTGRMGVEQAASFLRDFHHGKLNLSEMNDLLNRDLENVKDAVRKKGSPYISALGIDRAELLFARNLETVNSEARNSKGKLASLGYEVVVDGDVTAENRSFQVKVLDEKGQEQLIKAYVGGTGEFGVGNELFDTISDIVFAKKRLLNKL